MGQCDVYINENNNVVYQASAKDSTIEEWLVQMVVYSQSIKWTRHPNSL